ncbi:sugar kinase [Actinomadura viridis]|uniref:2-dehydro-3-deoxygluconokinase n=1 Tax=Actinomadura viridis TaxID=58110 RepID=A0A931GSE9_9ACTN|nr:sugar kinase [Actinomadura viridis]MBG6093861.1 2-dehydro-3-deoxygluconokinase [Actinomadura viridis]
MNGPRPDVAGVGEAMVLLQSPAGGALATAGLLEVHVGGAELNACATVARLGLRAWFASRVGDDPFGTRVVEQARALDVGTGLVTVDPDRPTGVFFKDALPDGRRRVHYYRSGSAASALDVPDAARILAARPRALLLSGITVALGPSPAALVRELAARARGAGSTVVLDPNLRPALGSYATVLETLRSLLPAVDLLALGQDEAAELLGTADPAEVFAAARAAGVREVLLKAGPDGAWYAGEGGAPRHEPSAAGRVVDPVGAGDAMLGGYLAARLAGAPPAAAARLGSRLAAGVIATVGDTRGLPGREEARALLATATAGT